MYTYIDNLINISINYNYVILQQLFNALVVCYIRYVLISLIVYW